MNHLPTHHPWWTSNPLSSCFLTCQIWLVIGTHLCYWFRPPRSYSHPSHRADKLQNVYPSDAGSFLSHLLDVCCPMCGIRRDSVKTAYHLKAFQYPVGLWIPMLQNQMHYFFEFYSSFNSGRFEAFLYWGGCPPNCVSKIHPIYWFGLHFASLC